MVKAAVPISFYLLNVLVTEVKVVEPVTVKEVSVGVAPITVLVVVIVPENKPSSSVAVT